MRPHSLKKCITEMLLLAAAFACTACGNRADGTAETPDPTETAVPVQATAAPNHIAAGELRITEVMLHNTAFLADENGSFPDWLELYVSPGTELRGCTLRKDGSAISWTAPEVRPEGEYLLLWADKTRPADGSNTGFSLAAGDVLTLTDACGHVVDMVTLTDTARNCALVFAPDGTCAETGFPSPGYENTAEGCNAFLQAAATASPLVINEVCAAGSSLKPPRGKSTCDWIELKNVSGEELQLGDYAVGDSANPDKAQQLPAQTLKPGACVLLYCKGDGGGIHVDFKTDADEEDVFLFCNGALADYMPLNGVPYGKSCGRMDGEYGRFLFETATPGKDNTNGCRQLAAAASPTVPAGVYDGVDALVLAFSNAEHAVIYYTTDGSLPTSKSERYTEPLLLTKTTVVRALRVEEGCLTGRAVTLNYIVNEAHTLPVVCVATDSKQSFTWLYRGNDTASETPGNFAYYGADGGYSLDCGISLSGRLGSLAMAKKGLTLNFDSKFGAEALECGIFGEESESFSTLKLRAGEDAYQTIYRNELWQDLCREMTDCVYAQRGQFCILYVNGEYYGIFALKEDFSKQYYADRTGCGKATVETEKTPFSSGSPFCREVLQYVLNHDLTQAEAYEEFSRRVDVESLIDWLILEGVSANRDFFANVRVFRSEETGGRWQFAFFDLDHSLEFKDKTFCVLNGTGDWNAYQLTPVIKAVLKNESFRDAFLQRYAEVSTGVLSDEHILEKMQAYEELLAPEVARDWQRWHSKGSGAHWQKSCETMRDMITQDNWRSYCCGVLQRVLKLTDTQLEEYFGT